MSRIAVVHDWFDCISESEKVVKEIIRCFPDVDVFSIFDHLTNAQRDSLGIGTVNTSFLQRIPFHGLKSKCLLPLMPLAVEQFDLSDYDVVISSHCSFAKGISTREDQSHICYVHSPNRFAWPNQSEEIPIRGSLGGIRKTVARANLRYMQNWDRGTANGVDVFLASSHYVASQIKKNYGRDSHVIYPPVDVQRFKAKAKKEDFFVAAGRLLPQKRFDLVVEAMRKMPQHKLYLIGDGPEKNRLRDMAGKNVELLGYQPEEVYEELLQNAKALVVGSREEFGITIIEAQACGTPVVALGCGGAAETILHGETGCHFFEQTAESMADAMQTVAEMPPGFFDPDRLRQHAESFSRERFCSQLKNVVGTSGITSQIRPPIEAPSDKTSCVITPTLQMDFVNEQDLTV